MGSPQLLAGLDVEKRQGEENYREQQHHYILHCNSRSFRRNAPVNILDEFGSRLVRVSKKIPK
jgi:hypothetical protein